MSVTTHHDVNRDKEDAIKARDYDRAAMLWQHEKLLAGTCSDCGVMAKKHGPRAVDLTGRTFCAKCAPSHGMNPGDAR